MQPFKVDQLRRQRRSYLTSIEGLEAVINPSPSQTDRLARQKAEIQRIERLLTDNNEAFDV